MLKINTDTLVSSIVKWIEKILAASVILGVIAYFVTSLNSFIIADWQAKEIFYELIYRVLLVTIGLELARMLVTHSFVAILELLAFVVARKMLKPDITSVDVVLGVVSFVAILAANYFFIAPLSKPDLRK